MTDTTVDAFVNGKNWTHKLHKKSYGIGVIPKTYVLPSRPLEEALAENAGEKQTNKKRAIHIVFIELSPIVFFLDPCCAFCPAVCACVCGSNSEICWMDYLGVVVQWLPPLHFVVLWSFESRHRALLVHDFIERRNSVIGCSPVSGYLPVSVNRGWTVVGIAEGESAIHAADVQKNERKSLPTDPREANRLLAPSRCKKCIFVVGRIFFSNRQREKKMNHWVNWS